MHFSGPFQQIRDLRQRAADMEKTGDPQTPNFKKAYGSWKAK